MLCRFTVSWSEDSRKNLKIYRFIVWPQQKIPQQNTTKSFSIFWNIPSSHLGSLKLVSTYASHSFPNSAFKCNFLWLGSNQIGDEHMEMCKYTQDRMGVISKSGASTIWKEVSKLMYHQSPQNNFAGCKTIQTAVYQTGQGCILTPRCWQVAFSQHLTWCIHFFFLTLSACWGVIVLRIWPKWCNTTRGHWAFGTKTELNTWFFQVMHCRKHCF